MDSYYVLKDTTRNKNLTSQQTYMSVLNSAEHEIVFD